MTDQLPTIPRLVSAPDKYDQSFFNRLVQMLDAVMRRQSSAGPVYGTTINLNNLPTAATGLRSGDVWRDTSTTPNTLRIVP